MECALLQPETELQSVVLQLQRTATAPVVIMGSCVQLAHSLHITDLQPDQHRLTNGVNSGPTLHNTPCNGRPGGSHNRMRRLTETPMTHQTITTLALALA